MHDLSFDVNGNAELVLGNNTSAWHGLGTVFPGLVSKDQAIAVAMPWQAKAFEMLIPSKQVLAETGVQITTNRTGRYAILRSDTANIIGFVGDTYEVVQPSEMFDFCEGVSVEGYETAGAIKGGSVLFLCAHVGHIDVLGSGDITRTYLTFLNSFDGSIAAQVYMSGVRIVCRNTMNMSLKSQSGSVLKFKHTKSVHDRLKTAQSIMESATVTEGKLKEALETLATRKLKKQTYEDILNDLFPGESTRTNNVKREITELFADNDNNAFPDFKGTAYNLYNAITNYADHSRDIRITKASTYEDTTLQRYESALIGTGAELKAKALERILVLSDGSEVLESSPIVSLPSRNITPKYLSTTSKDRPEDTAEDIMDRVRDFDRIADYDDSAFLAPSVEPTVESTVELYTTAPAKFDLAGTQETEIVEKVSHKVVVRKVSVPESHSGAQIAHYKTHEYFVADCATWTALQAQKQAKN